MTDAESAALIEAATEARNVATAAERLRGLVGPLLSEPVHEALFDALAALFRCATALEKCARCGASG